ncbi:MAG: hypothetical protein ACJ8HI_09195 [Massilia sp.]
MKKLCSLLCFALACCASASPALSANRSAGFDASLTIVETCRIDAAAAQAPVVACQMATPAAVSHIGAADNAPWMVSF